MQTLYRICLEILSDFADLVPDYSSVPFDPYIHDLLTMIMTRPWHEYNRDVQRDFRCKALDAIGKSHSDHIREKSEWTGISVRPPNAPPALNLINQRLPHFVCHLDLTGCANVGNESIYQLKPCIHLSTLDLTRTSVTDAGVATLARIALPHLRHLSVADNSRVSDASLRYIAEMATAGCLEAIDLTATQVDEAVATRFLKTTKGKFVRYRHDDGSSSNCPFKRLIGWNLADCDDDTAAAVIVIQTSSWLADLAVDKFNLSARSARPPAKSKIPLIYIKERCEASTAAAAAIAPVLVSNASDRRRSMKDEDAEHSSNISSGNRSKKPRLKLDDYLSLIEEDLGLV